MRKVRSVQRPEPRPIVFFDFDNTITTTDILDGIIERFSIDTRWIDLEERWKAGAIGSRECLAGQLAGVRITRRKLDAHLTHATLDPFFKKLLAFFDAHQVPTVVVSDNFDYIIKRIFDHHGVRKLPVYSNHVTIQSDRLITSFPLTNRRCNKCAHCKTTTIRAVTPAQDGARSIIYIGDGLSDICASQQAHLVCAKGRLLDECKKQRQRHVAYEQLKDVYNYFNDLVHEGALHGL